MNEAGHNNPPDMTVMAGECMDTLSSWMGDHPVIESEEHAREAKRLVDRAELCMKDLEDERDGKVRPLNTQVKEINDHYRPSKTALKTVAGTLEERLTAFMVAEENKRVAIAAEAARVADEAERAAREAERAEQAAIADANSGVLDVDIKAAVVDADDAFSRFKKAERQAQVAEKETKVRIGGGLLRTTTLRTKETLYVVDAISAINAIGLTVDITEAILKAARTYRKLHEELPPGVKATYERTI